MDDTFLGYKIFQIEGLEVGYIFGFAMLQFLDGKVGHPFGREYETVVVPRMGMKAKNITCFGSTIADKGHLTFFEESSER